jgi:regulator of nucleoside diphosphate kinase
MNNIFITEPDYKRLIDVIQAERQNKNVSPELLAKLGEELKRAKKVAPAKIPADVVTMNSTVLLKDLNTGKEMTLTLVYPSDADIKSHKISVLAPVGTALLGYKAGDIIEWKIPSGTARFQIEEIVYQPESAGVTA